MKKIGKIVKLSLISLSSLSIFSASTINASAASMSFSKIEKSAKKEGKVNTLAMGADYVNWGETWNDIKNKYGIKHTDTDLSSAQELQKFKTEGKNATVDMGDIALSVAPTAVKEKLLAKYKTNYWKYIPSWAKDKNGYWALGYTGTIAFITDTKNVSASKAPTSWKELLNGKYQVSINDVSTVADAQYGVLAAAYANGGSVKNIKPGLKFFAKLNKENRLSSVQPTVDNLKKGETQVSILWDCDALYYKHLINSKRYKVTIPSDGSVTSGYAEVINKYAPHKNAAKLARNYILSKKGQINLAKGYARPIRTDIKLPSSVKSKLIPDKEYKKIYHIKDVAALNKMALRLPKLWQSEVLGK
ncbi:MAG: ABC transporter substrate-binding protein [Oenococcus oeni]|uniref:ABC transporter substrate-binding protein n=1 Tax=Oenococcus oeni TaxID=1247 RepID=UPI0010B2B59B|nr:ABC transporter substrate-binding protein [Oenococcus oeni]SYV99217.1 conserved exported hypothetical protein [Oenococcus oeni]